MKDYVLRYFLWNLKNLMKIKNYIVDLVIVKRQFCLKTIPIGLRFDPQDSPRNFSRWLRQVTANYPSVYL